ncbi:MAG: hypothetical protein EHJ95_02715 [Methanobacteriota archaeon]|nr:MAG: hypothetical protein EHJ95_02715 [Euryarchaeota archaeon]
MPTRTYTAGIPAKGKQKENQVEYWCEICGAAGDEITEDNYPDVKKARHLCPGCRETYDAERRREEEEGPPPSD